jgi:hypothetical protein
LRKQLEGEEQAACLAGGMSCRRHVLLVVVLSVLLGETGASAQAHTLVPPKTVYWLSMATQSGFGMAPIPSRRAPT